MSSEHTSIQFELSKELKEKIENIFYDHKNLSVYFSPSCRPKTSAGTMKAIRSKVHASSLRATLEQFDRKVDGLIDPQTKLLCVYSIKYNLRKYVKFDDAEQKWYSEKYPDDPSINSSKNEDGAGAGIRANAELVLDAIKDHYKKLFVDEYQNPHIAISVSGHVETLPIKSKRFRNWLANIFYKTTGLVVKSQDLKDAINILSAQAEFDSGDPIKLNLRVAALDGKWYYDLTNKPWEFVEITSVGWKIVNNLILFHRYSNQLPQVNPSREYPSDIFDKFIKLVLSASVKKDKLEEYKVLLICYIVCAFVPDIPKAVPMPFGHQGAAKTSIMEFIKMLVDPSAIKTLSFPTDINELIQQLSHNYLAFYDNVSVLRDRTSDQLCRAVTGSGSSKRVLYSDDDDFIRSFKRCIGLNGINLAATKPDLLDRALFFELKRIENKDRRKIEDIWTEFEAMRSQLLGYILDILVKVLRWKNDHGKLNLELPRMADWAEWCEIISRCIGNKDAVFLEAFQNNRKIQIEQIIESSQVATCLTYYVDNNAAIFDKSGVDGLPKWGFEGTPSELLEILQLVAPSIGIDARNKWWPKAPNALSRRLNEIAHTLREAGIEIESLTSVGRDRVRNIRIRKIPSISTVSSQNEKQAQKSADNHDDNTNKPKVSSQVSSQRKSKIKHKKGDYDDTDDTDDTIGTKNISP
jgi:hypothetical protein